MLMPKRVKRRRVFRGKMSGRANKGNTISYGDYGLMSTEAAWITSNQIEAARIAMTRSIKRGGKVWIKIFPHKPVTKNLLKQEWVLVKVHLNFGWLLLSREELCSKLPEYQRKELEKR